MIPNDRLINALRELGYAYKRETERVVIYKKRGSTARATIRRNAEHDNEYVRTVLRQAGMSEEAVARFIAQCLN